PRQVVAATFTLANDSRTAMEIESRIVLPAGWQAVVPPAPFALAPGERALKLISFTIPEGAPGGDYTVRYEARDRQRPGIGDSYGLQVRVMSSTRVQVLMLELPDFAVSGDVVDGAALLRNAGNVRASVNFQVTGKFIANVSPSRGQVILEPAETRRVELKIDVGRVTGRATARITFTAASAESPGDVVASGGLPLVPRASAFDALRTLDSRVELRVVGRDAPAGRTSGLQPAIFGGGVLSEERDDTLSYHFRGPDRRDSGTFGASEEYWLQYKNHGFQATAGDLTYGLTPLTEPGRLGRGVFLGLEGERFGASLYGMNDTFGSGDADQFGAGARMRVTPDSLLGVNFLRRGDEDDRGDIWSLRAQAFEASGVELDMEIGQSSGGGTHGGAVRFALRDDRRAVRYYALGWSAGSEFEGPLRDKLYLSTGFDYPNPGSWGLRGYYRLQDWNLTPLEEIDPDLRARRALSDRMQSAPTDQQVSLGTGHSIGPNATGTLDLVYRERGERESGSWRAGLNRTWRNFSLAYSLEQGAGRNERSAAQFDTSLQVLSGSLRVGRSQTYGVYWMRDENSELSELDGRRESAGVSASFSGVAGWSMNLDAQRSQSRFGRGAIYDIALVHQAERGGRLTLCARRLEGRFARTDFMMGYSVPFAMPVTRRSDVARLRGRVFDSETAEGLRNVVLRVDGAVVATNTRGEFRFPAVSVGAHQIVVEHGTDVNQVPAGNTPLAVTVSGRDAQPVMIAMVRSVVIGVLVTLHPEGAEAARGAAGVLVDFRQGDTAFRRLTDAGGRVRLGGLAPGTWRVSLAADTVPEGYRSEVEDLQWVLAPGETVNAEIPLTPVRRSMRMLTPLAVR
ncbi:MAG TPA: NEW3 domain-containing protein, partial [Steroidobacteraceae bacterium]